MMNGVFTITYNEKYSKEHQKLHIKFHTEKGKGQLLYDHLIRKHNSIEFLLSKSYILSDIVLAEVDIMTCSEVAHSAEKFMVEQNIMKQWNQTESD